MRFKSSCFLTAAISLLAVTPMVRAQTVLTSIDSPESAAEGTERFAEDSVTEWSDLPEIKSGFIQGCVGEVAQLTEQQAAIKENYCQCAFEAYSSRYTPQQVLQVNAISSQIGENGLALVNLIMAPDLNSCASLTAHQF